MEINSDSRTSTDFDTKGLTRPDIKALSDIVGWIYAETKLRYDAVSEPLDGLGYKILYGPPHHRPPILFLGFQPGGGDRDALEGEAAGERSGWPEEFDYVSKRYLLAQRTQQVWSKDLLERCVALNAVFFRSPSIRKWRELDPSLRSRLEAFCFGRAQVLAKALEPERIVVFGLGNFETLTKEHGATALSAATHDRIGAGPDLVRSGRLWGIPTLGIKHLSGARWSHTDITALRDYMASIQAEPT